MRVTNLLIAVGWMSSQLLTIALAADDPSGILRTILEKNRVAVHSGRGTFVESVRGRYVTRDEIEQEAVRLNQSPLGQEAITAIASFFNLQLAGQRQSEGDDPHRCQTYVFEGNKRYIRYVKLDGDEAAYFTPELLASFSDQRFTLTLLDDKILLDTQWDIANGRTNLTALIRPAQAVFMPEYAAFGRLHEYITEQMLSGDIVELKFEGGQHHISIRQKTAPVKAMAMSIELILDADKDYMVVSAKFFLGDILWMEHKFSEYFQTPNGFWFPRKTVIRTYAPLGGQQVVSSEKIYMALAGSVDFNIPIESGTFTPNLPSGTTGVDFTKMPPKDFIVNADGLKYLQ